jgi:HD-GYP domain-containing protein (c-di-GMP phosphodiesterase class II)
MRLISVMKASLGDVLGQAVLTKDGSMMLNQGVVLTQRYIEKLLEIGIATIYIEDDSLAEVAPQDPGFVKIKSNVVNLLSKSFVKLEYKDSKPKLDTTVHTITDIVEYLLEHNDINALHLSEIKTYDNYTYVHSLNTCVIALFFGVQMSLTRSKLIDLGMGALLHDVGKTKIPRNILNKPDRLNFDEFEIMKQHSQLGYDIVKKFDYISDRAKLVLIEHHERIDGSGYPKGLKGDKISLFARITAISDVYDAIVSDRVYRKGVSGNEAYEYILGGAGTLFDWELVNIFKNNFSIYPPGACVRLSNGAEAFIVKDNKGFPDRPVVRILYDEKGNEIVPYEINLIEKLDICIESIVI